MAFCSREVVLLIMIMSTRCTCTGTVMHLHLPSDHDPVQSQTDSRIRDYLRYCSLFHSSLLAMGELPGSSIRVSTAEGQLFPGAS